MTKNEQIEEMAKIYCKNEFLCSKGCQTNGCRVYEVSETLYNAGYRKVAENAVILTPEERDEEMKADKYEAVKEYAERLKELLHNDYIMPSGITDERCVFEGIDELLKEYEK